MQHADGNRTYAEIHRICRNDLAIHVHIVLRCAHDRYLRCGGCLRAGLHIILDEANLLCGHTTDALDVFHDLLVVIELGQLGTLDAEI